MHKSFKYFRYSLNKIIYSYNDGKSWSPIGGGIGFHTLSIGNNKDAIWAAGSDGKVARLVEIKDK